MQKAVQSHVPGMNTLLAGLLVLVWIPGLAQWSDRSVGKVCADQQVSAWFRNSYNNIAKNLDSAAYFSEKGIRLADAKKNRPAICLGYCLLSRIHLLTPDYTRALEYYDLAYAMEERMQVPELDAYLQYVMAVKNMMLGRVKEAIGGTSRAVMIYEKLHDTAGMISLYKFMGLLYMEMGQPADLSRALLNFKKTLSLLMQQKDQSRVGSLFAHIGVAFMKQNRYDSANRYILKAIANDIRYNNHIWLATDYMSMGELKMVFGQYDSAEYYMQGAAQYFTHPNDQALHLISLGKVKQKRKEYGKAMELFREAYRLVRKSNNQATLGKALSEMVSTAEMQNDPVAALRYLKEYVKLKDTLNRAENIPAISLLEIQRQHDLKTTQMEVEKEKLALVSQRKSSYIIVLVILSVLLILISVVIIYFLRLRQRAVILEKAELDKTLEFRNRELALQVMNLMKRNEFIIETSRRLIDIPSDMQPEVMKTEVIRIAKSLQDQTDKEIWEEFELRFRQVHSGFYERLLVKFPDLTPNDLKICGLLRLNLTTKEMAELTGQRREAIEMARFRLRKHLGLNDPQVNLVTFLGKI